MDDTEFPTEAELSELLDSLLAGWVAQPTTMTSRPRNLVKGQVLTTYTLAAHTHRVAEAAAKLWHKELHLETVPLIRSAFEYALTAQFVAQCEDGVDGFFTEQARTVRISLEQIAAAGWKGAAEIADRVEEWEAVDTPAALSARRFDVLCDDLEPGGKLSYAVYRNLSSLTHPSRSVVARYLTEDQETVLQEPKPFEDKSRAWLLYLLCVSLTWAGRAIDMLLRDHPRRSELRRVARQLGIPPELQVSQNYRARQYKASSAG